MSQGIIDFSVGVEKRIDLKIFLRESGDTVETISCDSLTQAKAKRLTLYDRLNISHYGTRFKEVS